MNSRQPSTALLHSLGTQRLFFFWRTDLLRNGKPGLYRSRTLNCGHDLRHALTSFLVEIGTDSKTIQDKLRWADPSILLKVYAHSRMDKRTEAQANMIEAMGLNEQTVRHLM